YCLRLRTRKGTVIVVAVTLCAEVVREPVLIVHGSRERAELHYTEHRLVIGGIEERYGRDSPLRNLLDHLRDPAVPLNSPLTAAGAFTRVLEAVRTAPDPAPIDPAWLRRNGKRVDVDGVDHVVDRAAEQLRTFAELDVPWSPLARVARYSRDDDVRLPLVVPRPALHPVRTLGGLVVTGEHPADHPWHRGIGLALPDVNGVNLWGGRNYVPGQGYVPGELGRVEETGPGELAWCDSAGAVLLRERRRIRRRLLADGWELEWTSVLTAAEHVVLHSPGSKGREGAGYGGWFWRLPDLDPRTVRVLTPDGAGEAEVNGRSAPWLAVVVDDPDRPWTAVLSGPTDPWFVRVAGYQGIGSALAWREPVVLEPGGQRGITVRVAFHDGVRPP
ncbi:MAG: oxidoreductase, partial [Saccharothrix sp.]|nr:oxidoreductase [Saccharothrix sp.]